MLCTIWLGIIGFLDDYLKKFKSAEINRINIKSIEQGLLQKVRDENVSRRCWWFKYLVKLGQDRIQI